MTSNFVSPEPERLLRLDEARSKLIGDVLRGKKNPAEAMKEYKQEKQKIENERRMDKYRNY